MNFNEYQEKARKTAIYPQNNAVYYPSLGLAGETGEVCEAVKKQIRDNNAKFMNPSFLADMRRELGDVLWYISNLASDLHLSLEGIAKDNIEKLADRQKRNKLHGSGDNR
jgi:NTP pyrophosphatase (non-canonical NTP hydrolase)